jgi:hypothetical protein
MRIYIAQQWLGRPNEAIEDASYDRQASCRSTDSEGLAGKNDPHATPLLKFRRMHKAKTIITTIFKTIKGHLAAKGLIKRGESMVDMKLIELMQLKASVRA